MTNSETRNPKNCGSSLFKWGVAICKLECAPCPLLTKGKCAKVKMDRFAEAIRDMIRSDEDD